jgi:magnesium-transporting ATPase (P-type)
MKVLLVSSDIVAINQTLFRWDHLILHGRNTMDNEHLILMKKKAQACIQF